MQELTSKFNLIYDSIISEGKFHSYEVFNEVKKVILCKILATSIFYADNTDEIRSYYQTIAKDKDFLDDKILISDSSLNKSITVLSDIDIKDVNIDSIGRLFEQSISKYYRSEKGQFFTPECIVKLIIDLFDIKPTDRILDCSCGSGGFLLYAMHKIKDTFPNQYQKFIENNVYGIELDKTVSNSAKLNFYMEGANYNNIINTSGISSIEKLQKLNPNIQGESFD